VEQDPETKGTNNSYTTEFREYDPRLARWMSIDPKFKEWESPYVAFSNNPIWFNDPTGADSAIAAGASGQETPNGVKWKVEEGDTWATIAKRAHIEVEDLKAVNGLCPEEGGDRPDAGSQINLPASKDGIQVLPTFVLSTGTITVEVYNEYATNVKNYGGVQIQLTFKPDNGDPQNYVFFQTVETNQPKERPGQTIEGSYANDLTSAMRGLKDENGKTVTLPGLIYAADVPKRSSGSSWKGTLTLCKKVGATFVIVGTLQYGWTSNSSGQKVFAPLEFNPQGPVSIYHQAALDTWQAGQKLGEFIPPMVTPTFNK
jgi:RHS repeat-associated protein